MSLRRSAEHGFTSLRRSAEHGFTSLRRSTEHGFTLIEMVVALAVFGLAALALLRLEGMTLRTTAALGDRSIGQIVVRNLAVELLTDARAPTIGAASGSVINTGRSWRWTRSVRRTDDPTIVRIDLGVADETGRTAGRLTFARPT